MTSVVVVNFNGGPRLVDCVAALSRQSSAPRRIVIVDNGSCDGSLDGLRGALGVDPELAERIHIVEAEKNLGFAAANNRAIAMCDTDFVALLNPDAFPRTDWLEKLLAAAERHPRAAAFGSRQMIDGQPGVVDGIGDVYHVSGLSWRKGHGRRLRDEDLVERAIFSPCAAAALYRRSALLEVGGFDEDFFCYFEDVDLGFRLRLAGYECVSVPDAVVDHVGSASSGGKRSDFAVYHGHRNLVWCFLKNVPNPLLPPLLLAHFLQSILLGLVFTARGQGPTFFRAKWHAVKKVAHFWKKRRAIQRERRASCQDVWQALDKSLWRS